MTYEIPSWRPCGPLRTRRATAPGGGATYGQPYESFKEGGALRAVSSPALGQSGIPATPLPQSPPLRGRLQPTSPHPPHPRGSRHPADIWGPFLHSRFPASLPFRSVNHCPTQLSRPRHPGNYHSLLSLKAPLTATPVPTRTNILEARLSIADSKIRSHQLCDRAQILI